MYRVHYRLKLYYTNVTGSCKLHKVITFAPICHFQQCVPLAQSQEMPAGMATLTGSFKKYRQHKAYLSVSKNISPNPKRHRPK